MKSRSNSATNVFRTLPQLVNTLAEEFRTAENETIEDVLRTATFLVLVFSVVTPLLALGANVPLFVILPIAGISYGVYVYWTDRIFSGAVSTFFILSVFSANIPLSEPTLNARLDLYLADPIALLLLAGFVYDAAPDFRRLAEQRLGLTAVISLAIFVFWAYLSAIVGNGPSRFAATVFAVEQTRYLGYFVLSLLIVRRTDARFGLYPLMLSIGGNLLYAFAEALSGHTFGLTYLGDLDGKLLGELVLGSWTLQTGFYAGGYVGHVRELIGLLLLLAPFLVFWIVYGDRLVTGLCVLGIFGTAFMIRFGQTDSGLMTVLLIFAAIGLSCLLSALLSKRWQLIPGSAASAYGILLLVLLHANRFLVSNDSPDAVTDSPDGSGGSGSSGSPDGSGGGQTSESFQSNIVELFGYIPVVNVDTLGIRLTQYAAAIDLALLHPLVGIGGYNFVRISATYGLPPGMGVHNTFFSHLAATGLPGAVAYTVSVLSVVALAGRGIVRTTGKERLFWSCAFAGLLGFHAYSFWVVIYAWQATNAGFWASSGIVVGALSFGSATTGTLESTQNASTRL